MAAALSFTACSHEVHDFSKATDPDKPSSGETGYLAAELSWEQPEDQDSTANDIHISIKGTDNNYTGENEVGTVEDASNWLKQLTVGEFDVLVTTNMTLAEGYIVDDGIVSLADPSSATEPSWFAMAHVSVVPDKITYAEFKLHRLTAAINMTINDVPEGSVINVTVENAAQNVNMKEKDYQGQYGRPSSEYVAVPITMAPAQITRAGESSTLTSGVRHLLPTSRDFERTYFDIVVITPNGEKRQYKGDAPRMDSGYDYNITIEYKDLRPYMKFSGYSITDWTLDEIDQRV